MDLKEAKRSWKKLKELLESAVESAGYIVEDTDDWDEADMPIGTPKQRADRVKKHKYFRDLFMV